MGRAALIRRGMLTTFLYQGEEYLLFLSEYDVLTGQEKGQVFTEMETEGEQVLFREADYKLFLEKKSGSLVTQEAVDYSGGILLVRGLLPEYEAYEDIFSYETVLELIFKKGCLITTVDHSKAVLRVRKNLEKGLRSMNSVRDRHCIRAFLHRTVICDYRQSRYAYGKKKLIRNLGRGLRAVKGKVLRRQTE